MTSNPAPASNDTCVGCRESIPDGRVGYVTVTSRGHVRTVHSHEDNSCRERAHYNTVHDPTWVRGPQGRDS